MRISASDAKKFLADHVAEVTQRVHDADANNNGNLTRREAKELGADLKDTFDLYKESGRTVRTDDFLKFYIKHAQVSARSGELAGDLVDNFQQWRTRPSPGLSNDQRADIVWDVMGPWGPVDGGPRFVRISDVPPDVKAWMDNVEDEVTQLPNIQGIHEIYEVPVSSNDARVAGYAIVGYGENDTSSVAYGSLSIYSPSGELLDADTDNVSI